MARSRVRGTNGKSRKKNKNRDSLLASQQVWTSTDPRTGGSEYRLRQINDNKPHYVHHDTTGGGASRRTTTTVIKDDEKSRNPVGNGSRGGRNDTSNPRRGVYMRPSTREHNQRLRDLRDRKKKASKNVKESTRKTQRQYRGINFRDQLPPPRY